MQHTYGSKHVRMARIAPAMVSLRRELKFRGPLTFLRSRSCHTRKTTGATTDIYFEPNASNPGHLVALYRFDDTSAAPCSDFDTLLK